MNDIDVFMSNIVLEMDRAPSLIHTQAQAHALLYAACNVSFQDTAIYCQTI